MIRFISVEEASGRFAELVKSLGPGDEVVLNNGVHAVGRIYPLSEPTGTRLPYRARGTTAVITHDASVGLAALLRDLAPGGEVTVTEGTREVARLVAPPSTGAPRKPGSLKGKLKIIDDSDDVILEHFKDYL